MTDEQTTSPIEEPVITTEEEKEPDVKKPDVKKRDDVVTLSAEDYKKLTETLNLSSERISKLETILQEKEINHYVDKVLDTVDPAYRNFLSESFEGKELNEIKAITDIFNKTVNLTADRYKAKEKEKEKVTKPTFRFRSNFGGAQEQQTVTSSQEKTQQDQDILNLARAMANGDYSGVTDKL